MRKLSLLIALAMMALAVFPVFAQDEESNTIADIVVASASAEEGAEFTVLLAAVQAADPTFLDLLSGDYPYTVFAPTDAAFVALLEALDTSAEDLLANTELLNTVLAYHVIPGPFDSTYFLDAAEDGALVGTALYESALAFTLDGETLMVNDASVVSADIMADNGYVHVIDSVLVPDMGEEDDMMAEPGDMMEPVSIAETVIAASEADEPQFTILLAAVLAADPELPSILTDMGPWTVFAPTDDAFAALLEALGVTAEDLLADTDLLNEVLAYHLVPGHFAASTVVAVAGAEGGVNVATVNGAPINIALDGDGVVLNGEINVIATDVHASNGIIHVIDAVLLPPEDME